MHLHVHQARQVSNEIVSRGWKIIRLVDTVVFAHELGTRPNGLRGKGLPGRSNFSIILGQKSNEFIFSSKLSNWSIGRWNNFFLQSHCYIQSVWSFDSISLWFCRLLLLETDWFLSTSELMVKGQAYCTPSTFKRGPSCLPCHQKMFKIIFKERLTGQAVDDWKTPGRNDAGNDRSFFSLFVRRAVKRNSIWGGLRRLLTSCQLDIDFNTLAAAGTKRTALLVDNVDVQS